jgi:hypothetical protein
MTADIDSERNKMLVELPYINNMSKMESIHKEVDFNFGYTRTSKQV